MLRRIVMIAGIAWACWVRGAELSFDFSTCPLGSVPPGWTNLLYGEGRPGEWKVVMDEVASPMPKLFSDSREVTGKAVVAQVSTDPTDERYPLLVYEREKFHDFTLTTRFKTVSGEKEQMAGLVFRLQDAKNFYVVRASSLGSTVRFYKVVDGRRAEPVGVELPVSSNAWHELTIQCKGSYIDCLLDGKQVIPKITDYSYTSGKIGFWTKSDSVSYFTGTRLEYTRREPLAANLVRDTIRRYPRVVELTVFTKEANGFIRALASNKPERVGDAGGVAEQEVLNKGVLYSGKSRQTVTVTLPLHDRNGEPIASVRVVMKSFTGQTDQNAIARAMPIVKQMEARVRNLADLTE